MKTAKADGAFTPLVIESLDQEGRGIARREGKTIFVEGALPGERAIVSVFRKKPTFEIGFAQQISSHSSSRTTPRCAYFGVCGGCALQHVQPATQVAAKQRVLEDALTRIGKVTPQQMLAPIHGPAWRYRHRARFTVRYVPKKGGALVGFHEKRSSFVADMASCEVVPERISALLKPLRELITNLSARQRIPQIELAVGDNACVLVLRVLESLSTGDESTLRTFADTHGVILYLQPGGPLTVRPFHPPEGVDLHYALSEFGVRIHFEPTDFTQVNHAVNRVLVRRALSLLDPQPGERIGDMFCGLGNFSLPIARSGAQVLGIEGSEALVARARTNAAHNGLAGQASFKAMNLFEIDASRFQALGRFDRMLIDPPRDGAIELVKALDDSAPQRLVYVSCNAGTLARDASVLVFEKGYTLKAAGVINMFPHTAHVESIALFTR